MSEWSYFFWGLISQPLLNCVEGWQTAQFKKKNLYSIAISLKVQLIAQIKELAYN